MTTQDVDLKLLREIFNKYSTVKKDGVNYMTPDGFIRNYLLMLDHENYNKETVTILGNALSLSDNGLISFDEFQTFETVLKLPDSLYHLAFQLFDVSCNGKIEFEEVRKIFSKTSCHQQIPFNWNCEFIRFHFGKNLKKTLSYHEFGQFLEDLQYEHTTQAFNTLDTKGNGTIPLVSFKQIMETIRPHMLTEFVQDKLIAVMQEAGQSEVSYAHFKAFNHLLKNMELVKKIYMMITKNQPNYPVSKDEFMLGAQRVSHLTPLEVDLLFRLSDLRGGKGRITMTTLDHMTPCDEGTMPYYIAAQQKPAEGRSTMLAAAENAYRFGLGVVAGGVGATAVYPIDLVKTRLQNQRSTGSYVGELMYRNSFDCFFKVIRHEGVTGLYRGLIPQLVGVGPEKAIKLTMNDFVRDQLRKDGEVPLWGGMLAGGVAGGSQVVFTNPLEIVKIRLQVAGEIATVGERVSAITVIKELGLTGLYKGARACLLRDIPFSAIYFPGYAHAKQMLAGPDGHVSPGSILLAGTIAGAPAASLTTPADVIKTRLQVKSQAGQTVYKGVIDCAKKVYAEEGFAAFWKGAPARVCRSSPQFGVTLLTYELLQRFFDFDFGGSKPIGATHKPSQVHQYDLPPSTPDHIGGYRLAAASFAGIERRFGLALPRFEPVKPAPVVQTPQQQPTA